MRRWDWFFLDLIDPTHVAVFLLYLFLYGIVRNSEPEFALLFMLLGLFPYIIMFLFSFILNSITSSSQSLLLILDAEPETVYNIRTHLGMDQMEEKVDGANIRIWNSKGSEWRRVLSEEYGLDPYRVAPVSENKTSDGEYVLIEFLGRNRTVRRLYQSVFQLVDSPQPTHVVSLSGNRGDHFLTEDKIQPSTAFTMSLIFATIPLLFGNYLLSIIDALVVVAIFTYLRKYSTIYRYSEIYDRESKLCWEVVCSVAGIEPYYSTRELDGVHYSRSWISGSDFALGNNLPEQLLDLTVNDFIALMDKKSREWEAQRESRSSILNQYDFREVSYLLGIVFLVQVLLQPPPLMLLLMVPFIMFIDRENYAEPRNIIDMWRDPWVFRLKLRVLGIPVVMWAVTILVSLGVWSLIGDVHLSVQTAYEALILGIGLSVITLVGIAMGKKVTNQKELVLSAVIFSLPIVAITLFAFSSMTIDLFNYFLVMIALFVYQLKAFT